MKVAQLFVAAALVLPIASAFAQSTPRSINDDVSAQIAQEQSTYRFAGSADQTQAAINGNARLGTPSRQLTQVNMGRYSLSVDRPSF
jgi:hypothetical protein